MAWHVVRAGKGLQLSCRCGSVKLRAEGWPSAVIGGMFTGEWTQGRDCCVLGGTAVAFFHMLCPILHRVARAMRVTGLWRTFTAAGMKADLSAVPFPHAPPLQLHKPRVCSPALARTALAAAPAPPGAAPGHTSPSAAAAGGAVGPQAPTLAPSSLRLHAPPLLDYVLSDLEPRQHAAQAGGSGAWLRMVHLLVCTMWYWEGSTRSNPVGDKGSRYRYLRARCVLDNGELRGGCRTIRLKYV